MQVSARRPKLQLRKKLAESHMSERALIRVLRIGAS